MRTKTNQEFVPISTARFKERSAQLCEQHGLQLVETEESSTSKASFLDDDFLPTIGEQPDSWKPSGKRTKRGLYCTGANQYINADCNGAANILRKVSMTLGIDLSRVCRGALTHPTWMNFWVPVQKKSVAMRLQPIT
jgi:transposase